MPFQADLLLGSDSLLLGLFGLLGLVGGGGLLDGSRLGSLFLLLQVLADLMHILGDTIKK